MREQIRRISLFLIILTLLVLPLYPHGPVPGDLIKIILLVIPVCLYLVFPALMGYAIKEKILKKITKSSPNENLLAIVTILATKRDRQQENSTSLDR